MSRWARVLFGWSPSRWSVGVTVVIGLAGVLFALSFATANGTDIRGGGRDLPSQILSLSRQVQAKSDQVQSLSDEIATITTNEVPTSSELRTLEDKVSSLSMSGGTTAVRGPGVTVSLDDAIQAAIWRISGSFMPRVVSAGVPTRMPEALSGGLVSYGIVFLFTVMPALPKAFSASDPRMPFSKTSTSIR